MFVTRNLRVYCFIKIYLLDLENNIFLSGLGHHIGALTAKSILDTFSNNDYVNILNYTDKTNYLVPCFENMLVQATKENIKLFSDAVDCLIPEGKTQLGQALEVAFKLLEEVCRNLLSSQCFSYCFCSMCN